MRRLSAKLPTLWKKTRELPVLSVQAFGIAVVPKMPVLSYMPVSIIEIEKPSWERLFYMATLKNVYQAPVIMDFKKIRNRTRRPVKITETKDC